MRWLKERIEFLSQVAIVISALSIWFISNGQSVGYIIGLATQPFWFYTSIKKKQWGIVIASVIFTISHINGLVCSPAR